MTIPPAGRDAPTMRCQLCGNTYVDRHICSAFTTPAAVSPDAPEPRADKPFEYGEGAGSPGEGNDYRDAFPERFAATPRPAGPTPEGEPREALSEKREADALKLCRERHNPLIEAACDRCIAEVIERNPSPEPFDRVLLIESRLRAYKNYAGYGGGFDRDIEYLLTALASARAALDAEKADRAAYFKAWTEECVKVVALQAALDEAKKPIPCGVCLGQPLKSGKPCICGGVGTEQAEMYGLRVALFDAQAAISEATRREEEITKAVREQTGNLVLADKEIERLRGVITAIRQSVDGHVRMGEEYSVTGESSFFGPGVSKTVTSKRGDLVDVRDDIDRIIEGHRPRIVGVPASRAALPEETK